MITPTKTHSQGFTLVEVMVAVVILAIGLLGMATLMMSSLQSSESAYSRSQASLMAYDILDRMRANKVDSSDPTQSFRVTHASVATEAYQLDNIGECPAVDAGDPNEAGAQKAEADLGQWCAQLQESMPNVASVTITAGPSYTVRIEWQEASGDTGSLSVEAQL